MINRRRVAPTLLAVLLALVLPASAAAVEYEVDSPADEPALTTAACLTAGGDCTLRAAIEVANATTAIADEITFDDSVFEGKAGDTIAPATVLPALSSPVQIKGGTCETAAGIDGPCVGVNGPSGEVGLEVTADGSSISGLSLTGLSFAIVIGSSSSNVTVQGNWIGVKLDGTAGGNANFGIFVDPNSDAATIGGSEAAQRNVIANTTGTALDLEGASEATIQGNYFGVGVDGETEMSNGKNIEITDREGFTPSEDVKAEDNEIGAAVAGAAATSAACDGGCNVIAGAEGTGIDLNGTPVQSEKPASGPTLIHGNFVGLDATGTEVVANDGFFAIWAGGADNVTVGGFPLGDANYVAGSSEGIVSENGENFIARGNWLGFGSDGSEVTPTGSRSIFVLAQSVSSGSSIEANHARGTNFGIDLVGLAGHITGNEVRENITGIRLRNEPGGGLIAGNTVEGAGLYGILVESPDNEIRANEVIDSDQAGIRVQPPTGGVKMNGNLVGGSTAEKENVIEGTGGPAIEIFEAALEPGSTTEIARNRGSDNAGLFIDLREGANEGIAPPAIAGALQTSATGTSLPGARIRVFSKAKAEAGELRGFLGETVADGSGNWKVTYPSIPAGTIVAATQTNANGGTSELSTATAAADPSGDPCKDALPPAQCAAPETPKPPVQPPAPTPDTKITKAPKAKSSATAAKFKFNSTVAGSSFECKLDKGKFKKCKSPKTYKKLKPGKHVFKVRAVGPTGLVDPTPAKKKFTVLK